MGFTSQDELHRPQSHGICVSSDVLQIPRDIRTPLLLDGRHTPDIADVRAVAGPTLRHRIVPNFNAEADGVTAMEIIERLLKETAE